MLEEKMAGEITISEDPGAAIRKWREEFGVSKHELATYLDISPSVISDYESGRIDGGKILDQLNVIILHTGRWFVLNGA